MVTGSERKALQIVYDEGGEASSNMVSRRLGIDTGYARLLCMNLAQKDYLDLKRSRRFRITYKGKRALGKTSSMEAEETDQRAEFKRISQERIGWEGWSNARIHSYKPPLAFDKQGQANLIWTTAKVDSSGRHFFVPGGRVVLGRLLTETTCSCGFCKGRGEKPKGTICPVCRGSREVSINPPAVQCTYCKGNGAHPGKNLKCTVCQGKGLVSVTEPIEVCTHCRGTGAEPNDKLPCLKCRGKGVVTKKAR